MERVEYKTMAYANDTAQLLRQLNELGEQGWEVCAEATDRTGTGILGRVPAWHERQLLLLKRHKEP